MIGLPLVLVMLEMELPTMVPGYPLKLTPNSPVRPLPLMVTTVPGAAPVGPVILVGTVVPLKIENVNWCMALSVGGVQPFGVAKVTELGVNVHLPPERLASKVLPCRSKEVGVTFVTIHDLLIFVMPVTPVIVTSCPSARLPRGRDSPYSQSRS